MIAVEAGPVPTTMNWREYCSHSIHRIHESDSSGMEPIDAWIARHNLDRYAESGKVDWFYLAHLSQDAVPVLARQDEQTRACLLAEGAFVTEPDRWSEWNLGRHRARRALSEWETSTANRLAPGGDAFLDLAQTTTCQSR